MYSLIALLHNLNRNFSYIPQSLLASRAIFLLRKISCKLPFMCDFTIWGNLDQIITKKIYKTIQFKTFTVVTNALSNQTTVFFTLSHFHPSLIFVGKYSCLPLEWSPTGAKLA